MGVHALEVRFPEVFGAHCRDGFSALSAERLRDSSFTSSLIIVFIISPAFNSFAMPLYVIGLGLGDERDVTVKGAEAIRKCTTVFLESYTSILSISKERLEVAFGRPIEIAWRETVESESHRILEPAKTSDVAFLVVGDPFGATTHTDLILRAQECGIETHIIHNASIMNACGACGLQLYNFGHTVSIPFFR